MLQKLRISSFVEYIPTKTFNRYPAHDTGFCGVSSVWYSTPTASPSVYPRIPPHRALHPQAHGTSAPDQQPPRDILLANVHIPYRVLGRMLYFVVTTSEYPVRRRQTPRSACLFSADSRPALAYPRCKASIINQSRGLVRVS